MMDFPGRAPDTPPAVLDPKRIPLQTKPEMLENFDRLMTIMNGGDKSTNPHITLPANEKEFKTSFARELLAVGKTNGLDFESTKRLFMGIYAIETGGAGGFDIMPSDRSTTALGYKQLLVPITMDLIYRYNQPIADSLRALAAGAPPVESEALLQKAKFVENLKIVLRQNLHQREISPLLHAKRAGSTFKNTQWYQWWFYDRQFTICCS